MQQGTEHAWYRADIDGLRAVAVLVVILFHARVPGFSGGFVGVDIFFVISGFLITSIIVRQLQQGTFSVWRFWERRVRRIIPALTVVLLATAAAGYWLILYPLDYLDFGQSLLAQAFFLSNVFFLRKSDYFAGPAEQSPLLHTWSLAIEEQFYVVFPVMLLLVWRFRRQLVLPLVLVAAVVSLVYSEYLLRTADAAFSVAWLPPIFAAATNGTAAFYWLPARAFALLLGAAIALSSFRLPSRYAPLAAGVGAGMIIMSVWWYTEATAFPGLAGLWPALGTGLLIMVHTVRPTIAGRLLSLPGVVWVGLLSYSLYLWHWPVLVLGQYLFGTTELSGVQTAGLLGLTVSLSVLTFHLVEVPLRTYKSTLAQGWVFAAGTVAVGVTAYTGWLIMSTNGVPSRAPATAALIAAATTDFDVDRSRCFVESQPCAFGPEDTPATHLVVGDSHAGMLLPAIRDVADDADVAVETYLSPGCSPLFDYPTIIPDSTCDQVTQDWTSQLETGTYERVLLVSRWSNYQALSDDLAEAEAVFAERVEETVDALTEAGLDVFVLLQVPNHPGFIPRTLFYEATREEQLVLPARSLPIYLRDHQFERTVFTQLASTSNLTVLDPQATFCDTSQCYQSDGETIWYLDGDHVNQTGARKLIPLLRSFTASTDTAVE